jgi:hypothetical protein
VIAAGVLIATAVPGVALAGQAGVSVRQTSETLTAGGTGTFDVTCSFDEEQQIAPVTWTLLDGQVDQQIDSGAATVTSTQPGMQRTGSLTLPLGEVAAGQYRLRVDCLRSESTAITNLFGIVVTDGGGGSSDVATSTTLTANPQTTVAGEVVMLVARVPEALDGSVRFYADGVDSGSTYGLNSQHEAIMLVTPTASTTYRAEYTGTEGYLPSTSADVLVSVVELGQPRLSGTVEDTARAGRTLTVDPGTWPAGTTFTFRWTRDYQPIDGAAGTTYTPSVADLGTRIGVDVVAAVPGVTDPVNRATTSVRVLAQPTITVGSRTVTSGDTAVLPITVAGPAGAPAPTGDVTVTVTGSTAEQVVTLQDGTASASFPNLAPGTYTVTVAYPGDAENGHSYARGASGGQRYLEATGTGTITVQGPAPTLTVADTLAVPVATAGVLTAQVGAPLPARYEVREGGTLIASGAVTGTDLSITLPVLTPGVHTLTVTLPATETTAAVSRTVTVTVTGEPPRATGAPTADLATPKAATAPGQQMDLVAEGFQPGETVAFYLHSDPVFLGTAVAGADGVARLRATVPADAPVGSHTVIATGGTSGRWAQLSVVLAAPGATPALAATGAQAGGLMTGAWLLLALGGGLVVAARKVRAAR